MDDAGAADARGFSLPPPDENFLLGTAGAPLNLFGPESAPTFLPAFFQLRRAGFNRFSPVFLTSETGGSSHWTHFLPPLPGLGPEASCVGSINAWDALPDGLLVTFPVYLSVLDQTDTSTLDPALTRARLQELVGDCLRGDARRLGEAYLQDEPANHYVSSLYDNDSATYRLENIQTLAEASRAILGRPTFLVEAPIPFLMPYLGVPPAEAAIVEPEFWRAVDRTAPAGDYYGFDVYPVDLTPNLTPIVEYLAHAKTRAPQSTPIIILQGSGYRDLGNPLGTTGRRPTRAESRAMAFAAVAAGARGLYWFGQGATALGDGELWSDILEVVSDVHELSGALTLPHVSFSARAPLVGAATRSEGQTFVVLANLTDRTASTELPVEGLSDVWDAHSGELVKQGATAVDEVSLGPYGARFLIIARR